jgi:hypothetical protein
MEPKRASAGVGPVFVPDTLGSPMSAGVHVLRDLIWALFWKKVHFRGVPADNFKAAQRETALEHVTSEWLQEAMEGGIDPIEATLHRLWQVVSGVSSADGTYPEQWKKSETTLNARCALGFALLGGQQTTRLLRELVPEVIDDRGSTSLALLNMSFAGAYRSDFDFGQPDLLLRGTEAVWMCEMKVRGTRNSACPYGPEQFLKYMTLAAAAARYWPGLRVVHLIFGPTTSRRLISNRTGWFAASPENDGQVAVDVTALCAGRFRSRWAGRVQDDRYQSELSSLLGRVPIHLVTYATLTACAAKLDAPDQVRMQWAKLARAAQPERRPAVR